MPTSAIDEVLSELPALGVTLERRVDSKHTKLYLRNRAGCECILVLARSTAQVRSVKNEVARLRRFARLTEQPSRC